ncbi:MAG: hypothetical protein K8S87_02830 [Planctomycetes bacterium]|nr:hypothetical protein [Planctomycetota bacterium]
MIKSFFAFVVLFIFSTLLLGKTIKPVDSPKEVQKQIEHLFEKFELNGKYKEFVSRFMQFNNSIKNSTTTQMKHDGSCPLVMSMLNDPLSTHKKTRELTDRIFENSTKDDVSKMLETLAKPYNLKREKSSMKMPEKGCSGKELIKFFKNMLVEIKKQRDAAFMELDEAEDKRVNAQKFLYDATPMFFRSFNHTLYIDAFEQNLSNQNVSMLHWGNKVNRIKLLNAGYCTGKMFNQGFLKYTQEKLTKMPSKREKYDGVKGEILAVIETEAGDIVIGGSGKNEYINCKAALIIDVGGKDIYGDNVGVAVTADRPVSIVIDLKGDDTYMIEDAKFAQASAICGIAAICDLEGDDKYFAPCLKAGKTINKGKFNESDVETDVNVRRQSWRGSQAFAAHGVSMLVDYSGDDKYVGSEFSQGLALNGFAILYDAKGNDEYQADLYSIGVGLTNGVALSFDKKGNDKYKVNGPYPSTYGDKGETNAMSMGVGIGFRKHPQKGAGGYGMGGVGILLNGSGNDTFDVGQFGLGGGYFFGLGIVHTQKGNDIYNSQRYGIGFAPHQAIGVFLDDAGNDAYKNVSVAACAGTWDTSIAYLVDMSGDDTYEIKSLGLGGSTITSFSVFYDGDGKDKYTSKSAGAFGDAGHKQDKDRQSTCMAAFIDAGGDKDEYNRGGAESENSPKNDKEHTFAKKIEEYTTGYGVFSDN